MRVHVSPNMKILIFVFMGFFIPLLFIHFIPPFVGLMYEGNEFYATGRQNHIIDYTDFLNPIKDWIGAFILKEHRIPLWFNAQGIGIPLIEQTDFNLFNPLDWPNWFGSQESKQTIRGFFTAFYLALSSYGVFLFCNKIMYFQRLASYCGALVYSMAGVPFFYFTYFSAISMGLCLPYIIYFSASIILYEYKPSRFFGLVISLALLLVGGQPQFQFCIILFSAPFLLCLVTSYERIKRSGYLILAAIIASMIAAPQLIPLIKIQFGDYFSMHGISQMQPNLFEDFWSYVDPFRWAYFDQSQFSRLVRLAYPVFPGNYKNYASYATWPNDMEAFGLTFGTLGAFYLIMGLIFPSKPKCPQNNLTKIIKIFFICIMVLIFLHIWPFKFVNADKYMIIIISFLGCCLISKGVNDVNALSFSKRLIGSMIGIAIAILPFILYKILPADIALDKHFASFLTAQYSIFYTTVIPALILTSVSILILLRPMFIEKNNFTQLVATLFASELLLVSQLGIPFEKEWFRYIVFIFMAVSAILRLKKLDKWANGMVIIGLSVYLGGFIMLGKTAEKTALDPSLIVLKQSVEKNNISRFLSSTSLQSVGIAKYGIPTFTVRNPVIPTTLQAYFDDFLFKESGTQEHQLYKSMISFNGFTNQEYVTRESYSLSWDDYFLERKFYNLLGISHLISEENPYFDALRQKNTHLKKISTLSIFNNKFFIYQDVDALPRAYAINNYTIVPLTTSAWYARKWIKNHLDLLMNKFVVETTDNNLNLLDHFHGIQKLYPLSNKTDYGIVPATNLEEKSGYIKFKIKNKGSGIAVFSEQFHPNWIARVDGNKSQIVRVSSILLGVSVPDGEHQVEFEYFPPDYQRNFKISLLGVGIFVVFLLIAYIYASPVNSRNFRFKI